MLSRFFIDRPIFAWVIAIVIMLAGGAGRSAPCRSRSIPTIAPPAVAISAIYPGAAAETVQNTVTQVIEQQLTGLDNLLYFSSTSRQPTARRTITADLRGRAPIPTSPRCRCRTRCSSAVAAAAAGGAAAGRERRQGDRATSCWSSALYRRPATLHQRRHRRLHRLQHAGPAQPRRRASATSSVFGAQYAMRIWLDPDKLSNFSLTPGRCDRRGPGAERPGLGRRDRRPAAAAGHGAQRHRHRPVAAADARAVPQASSSRPAPTARMVRLGDVARVELGAENYMPSAPATTASRPPASPSSWRRAPTR